MKRAGFITPDVASGKTEVLAEKPWKAIVKREVAGTDD